MSKSKSKKQLLKNLTKEQREAVRHLNGPALVVAGPGSGKTAIITRRVAYLLKRGARAEGIVAVTFTNKAAREMKKRVENLVSSRRSKKVTCSTFHSYCYRLIKVWSNAGYLDDHYKNYSICDEDDAARTVEQVICKHFGLESLKEKDSKYPSKSNQKIFDKRYVRSRISSIKQNLFTPREWRRSQADQDSFTEEQETLFHLYRAYRKTLKKQQLFDFDDLLFVIGRALRKNKRFRKAISSTIDYLLVDEYQDTNMAQFEICKNLSEVHGNIFVVGDADQSIYKFRGADFTNVQKFIETYKPKGLKTYSLEKNFRSCKPITDVANSLIRFNFDRIEKEIDPVKLKGEKPQLHVFENQGQEAKAFANIVKAKLQMDEVRPGEVAFLYRTKVQSRRLEDECIRQNIPYRIIGSLGFYERKIVKDVFAYAKLLYNIKDNASFSRIHNYPPRGLGKAFFGILVSISNEHNCSLLEVLKYAHYRDSASLSGRQIKLLDKLRKIFSKLFKTKNQGRNAAELISVIIQVSGMRSSLMNNKHKSEKVQADDQKRLDHLDELLVAAKEFAETDTEGDLKSYLDWIALAQTHDVNDEEDNRVTLMTCHAAKGLEYKLVFVVGCCHNLLPHFRSGRMIDPIDKIPQKYQRSWKQLASGLEEERRLFYVAVTRAEEMLHVGSPLNIAVGGKEGFVGFSLFSLETWNEFDKQNYMAGYNLPEEDKRLLLRHGNIIDFIGEPGHDLFNRYMEVEGKPKNCHIKNNTQTMESIRLNKIKEAFEKGKATTNVGVDQSSIREKKERTKKNGFNLFHTEQN